MTALLRSPVAALVCAVLSVACLAVSQHVPTPAAAGVWGLASWCGPHAAAAGPVLFGHCLWCYLAAGFALVALTGIGVNIRASRAPA